MLHSRKGCGKCPWNRSPGVCEHQSAICKIQMGAKSGAVLSAMRDAEPGALPNEPSGAMSDAEPGAAQARKAMGATEVCFLKKLEKCATSSNPRLKAISEMFQSVCFRRILAS